MSRLPASFNPSGQYPFMDHTKSVIPQPPPPSKYARGVPSAHVTDAYSRHPPSPPSTQPPTPLLVAPVPQYAPQQMVTARSTSSASSISSSSSVSSVKPCFTLFTRDEPVTPDLEVVLRKKSSTWSKK